MGLPLAKAIVEAHDGTIQAESEPGWGTVFTLRFWIPAKLWGNRRVLGWGGVSKKEVSDTMEVKNLSKTYGQGEAAVHALRGATYTVLSFAAGCGLGLPLHAFLYN